MNTRKKMLVIGMLAIVAVLALLMIGQCCEHIHQILPQAFAAGGGGLILAGTVATPMPELEFQQKLLAGQEATTNSVKELKTQVQKVTEDLDRADTAVKKQMEEFTKLKNTSNTSYEQVMAEYKKLQDAIKLNARSSFRDPIERCLANEETRAWLNGAVRYALARSKSDFDAIPAEQRKLVEESTAKARSLTGVDSGLGQATVPQQTFNEIYDTLLEYGAWHTLGVIRVGMRTTVLPVATARPQFYWIGNGTGGTGESSAITEGAFTGSSVNLLIQTLAVYLLCARELLADSTVDLSPYLLREMVQSNAFGLDSVAFVGAGAANQTDAGYYGIFNAALVNTQLAATAAAGNTSVGATQLEDWMNCITTVAPQVLMRNPKWWMHPQILAKVALVRDKNGRPIFQTFQEAPSKSIGSILGAPVIPVGAAPTTDAAGATPAVFGDSDGQAIGIRSDLELATSDDIKFAENMRAFRSLTRAGVKLKTTTGSTTLKPFAVLTLPNA